MLGSLVQRLQTVGSPRPVRLRPGKSKNSYEDYREVQSDPEDVDKKSRTRRKLDKARRRHSNYPAPLQGSKSMGRLDGIKQVFQILITFEVLGYIFCFLIRYCF